MIFKSISNKYAVQAQAKHVTAIVIGIRLTDKQNPSTWTPPITRNNRCLLKKFTVAVNQCSFY